MNRSGSLYWLGICILTAGGMLSLAVFFSRSNAQDQVPVIDESVQEVDAPSATLFNYQGHLVDSNGNPISDSAVDMSFKFYSVSSGGTACWTENHTGADAIDVQAGYFNVLLGQLTAINTSCTSGDAYLEIVVNGETMAPRELLTSVVHAVEASGLSANATAAGGLTINGVLNMNANSINNVAAGVYADPSSDQLYFANDYGTARIRASSNIQMYIDSDNDTTNATFKVYKDSRALNGAYDQIMSLSESGDMSIDGALTASGLTINNNATIVGPLNIDNQGSIANKVDSGNGGPHVVFDTDDCFVFQNSAGMRLRLCGDANGITYTGNTWQFFGNNVLPTQNRSFDLGGPNNRWKTAFLESASCGAIVETNLQTEAEKVVDEIERFSQGDVLCWGTDQLEKCSSTNDRLVMSVADVNGKPIVMGAEPVKVLGPVSRGDILVSSDLPGYAMVNNDPIPGTVIAQALEDLDGESGLVKAMIRKW